MPQGLHTTCIRQKETDLQVLTDKPLDLDFVKERINSYRWGIENYINKDKRFLTALKPLAIELNAPLIVRAMAESARKANVGPMAAVAGAVAEFLGRDLLSRGYKDVIVENGGDIFLKTRKSRMVRIYSGRSKLWQGLRLKIKPQDTPLGVCTSSGVIGHSLNFGSADSVVILSRDTALADAVATATANRVGSKEDLPVAIEYAKSVKGILGAVIIIKGSMATWGNIQFVS